MGTDAFLSARNIAKTLPAHVPPPEDARWSMTVQTTIRGILLVAQRGTENIDRLNNQELFFETTRNTSTNAFLFFFLVVIAAIIPRPVAQPISLPPETGEKQDGPVTDKCMP